jgi:heme oxygenase
VYGFESPVESAIQMTPGIGERVDLRGRVHLKLLVSDLIALGVSSVEKLPRCRSVFPFRSVEDALAWAYVVERNMLLHGILRRHLERRLPEQIARAGAYLAGNERAVGSRMRELGGALDSVATTPGSVERIIVAAHAAFRCQRHWFAEVVPPRAQVA